MPINYSKWDALELSDDSDIEVHPNVDKKSFIRAKQAQIHQERDRRRHQIKTLKYERIINDGLIERIDRLRTALESSKDQDGAGSNTDQLVFQSIMEGMMQSGEDRPPPPPEGVHEHIKEKPTYPQMMASLVDQVKKEIDEKADDGNRLQHFIAGLEAHKERVVGLQKQLLEKLDELEKEEKRHITSDDIRDGFNYSNVRNPPAASSSKPQNSTVELLNPPKQSETQRIDTCQSSSADANAEEGTTMDEDEDEDAGEASPLAKEFSKIKRGDWSTCLSFITAHPQILAEKETDGLLVEAFNSEVNGKQKYAKHCVHQALLLQYCRQLGGLPGVPMFFKRVQTKDHQASKLFHDDVDSTYQRIHTRVAEINKEREANPKSNEGVEQIQLHPVDPNTTIHIQVPPKESSAEDPEQRAAEQAAREIFESFTPALRRALESGKLAEVNKALAKMSVTEAEEVVEKLGQGDMLSLEQGIVDATTEEGKRVMEEIARTRDMPERS